MAYSPLLLAFLGTLGTWAATALGAAFVFTVPRGMSHRRQRQVLDASLGFAGGVMLAASFYGLLLPALDSTRENNYYAKHTWVPTVVGLMLGAAFVTLSERYLPHENTVDAAVSLNKGISQTSAPASCNEAYKDKEAMQMDEEQGNASEMHEVRAVTQPDSKGGEDAEAARAALLEVARATGAAPTDPTLGAPVSAGPANGIVAPQECAHPDRASRDDGEFVQSAQEKQDSWRRLMLLVIAIVIHNFPEGLAVGVAFGALNSVPRPEATSSDPAAIAAAESAYGAAYDVRFREARTLAIAISLQNVAEGLAVSLPLMRVGMSRTKAFLFGQLSGMVEPVGGVIGALLVSYIQPLLPYALAFAAGAMIWVVIHELIPETRQRGGFPDLAAWFIMGGFCIMFGLDTGLG